MSKVLLKIPNPFWRRKRVKKIVGIVDRIWCIWHIRDRQLEYEEWLTGEMVHYMHLTNNAIESAFYSERKV